MGVGIGITLLRFYSNVLEEELLKYLKSNIRSTSISKVNFVFEQLFVQFHCGANNTLSYDNQPIDDIIFHYGN